VAQEHKLHPIRATVRGIRGAITPMIRGTFCLIERGKCLTPGTRCYYYLTRGNTGRLRSLRPEAHLQPWRTLFHGLMATRSAIATPTVTLSCRDMAKRLHEWLYRKRYSSMEAKRGTPLEAVGAPVPLSLPSGEIPLFSGGALIGLIATATGSG